MLLRRQFTTHRHAPITFKECTVLSINSQATKFFGVKVKANDSVIANSHKDLQAVRMSQSPTEVLESLRQHFCLTATVPLVLRSHLEISTCIRNNLYSHCNSTTLFALVDAKKGYVARVSFCCYVKGRLLFLKEIATAKNTKVLSRVSPLFLCNERSFAFEESLTCIRSFEQGVSQLPLPERGWRRGWGWGT